MEVNNGEAVRNRRVRNRTHGGVGGRRGRPRLLPDYLGGKLNKLILLCVASLMSLCSCTFNPASGLKAHLRLNSDLYSGKTFIAMQYYGGIFNRRVKVFVLEDRLSVGTIGGLLATPLFATEKWYDPEYYIAPVYAKRYENVDPHSEKFLSIDKSNYQILQSNIAKIEFDPTDKWGMGTVPHSGKILVQTLDGDEHEFILLGSQDGIFVKTMIEQTMQGTDNKTVGR
jgi:hypothetical protein